MNLLVQTTKPRRFRHPMMYSDERRERLQQLEARAKRELGMESGESAVDTDAAESLISFRRTTRRKDRSFVAGLAIAGLLLVFLLACFLPWL
ncbi:MULTISPECIES: hypothetical protein [Hallella]|uniref:Uncharacterized protein n=1 Tax=Hallella faecis TaxID=2841596 RepID=A0ABV1FQJ6_9BACT|nr:MULTISPECIES: hypothetical protein [Hallella]MBS7400471.1 hypothetical protein [Prevotella sp.]MBU0289902.1 hypothetical protein [Hallella faecis]MCI7434710.1 hypothetical protein [Prevotella sp.]MDR3845334.1 hypothetical protein [Hallella sp.]MDR4000731.1 hypothetical protein [Hallella sp.]